MTQPHHDVPEIARYRVHGMDCASFAMKIEGAARGVPGVEEVRVSIASQLMSLPAKAASRTAAVDRPVTALGYRHDRHAAQVPGVPRRGTVDSAPLSPV